MRPHRRQFIIGPTDCKASDHFLVRRLSCGMILSHDVDLPICENSDGSVILIGHAYCTLTGRDTKELVFSFKDINEDTKTWVGRWILYHKGELFSDVTTSLSMFYNSQANDFWVSSSISLLAKVDNSLAKPELVFKEKNFLAPTTCVEGVKQVMIGEKVSLNDGKVLWQGFSPLFQVSKNDAEILSVLAKRFETAALGILGSGMRVYSALTSGQDSRLDLAALIRVSKSNTFSTFTFVKNILFMNPGDRDLPRTLSKTFSFSHIAVRKGDFDEGVERIYREHCWTLRSTEPGSPFFYLLNGFWQQLPFGVANIDHCYEIGRNTLYKKGFCGNSPDFTLEDLRRDGYVLVDADYLRLSDCFQKINGEFTIDRRDALYLYKSYPLFGKLFQAQDLWVDSTLLGNSREIFSLLLSVPPGKRQNGDFHKRLVAALDESLASFPYNPSQPLWQKIFVRLISRMRNI